MALIGGVIRNSSNNFTLAFASACITGTITDCASTDGNGVWNALWGYEGVSVRHFAGGFNAKDVNYTSADVAWFPAYSAYGYWKVVGIDPAPAPPPGSCFTGDTRIQMADGSTKRISEVGAGELVIGRDGAISRIIDVERPRLDGRRLYAVNGSAPFVTSEHPFLTEGGWHAIDPGATAAENKVLDVGRLIVGSAVIAVRTVRVPALIGGLLDRADVEVEPVRITALEAQNADPSTIVYNLLLDSDHTYIANGFLVHNKSSH